MASNPYENLLKNVEKLELMMSDPTNMDEADDYPEDFIAGAIFDPLSQTPFENPVGIISTETNGERVIDTTNRAFIDGWRGQEHADRGVDPHDGVALIVNPFTRGVLKVTDIMNNKAVKHLTDELLKNLGTARDLLNEIKKDVKKLGGNSMKSYAIKAAAGAAAAGTGALAGYGLASGGGKKSKRRSRRRRKLSKSRRRSRRRN
jgi:hypothetical protein